MEKMDDTLDDLLDEYYIMSKEEWLGIFFQVAFGLSITNKFNYYEFYVFLRIKYSFIKGGRGRLKPPLPHLLSRIKYC